MTQGKTPVTVTAWRQMTDSTDRTAPGGHADHRTEALCGIGKCKPGALSGCANMPTFTTAFSLCALMTSTLVAYVNSQVTTLERQFGFSSAQTGLIMAANDVGFLVLILFVSFIAPYVHIPRGLGWFTILFGVSGLLCSLPHFLFGASSLTSPDDAAVGNISTMTSVQPSKSMIGQLCDGKNHTSLNCDVLSEGRDSPADSEGPGAVSRVDSTTAMLIIAGGMFLQGVAKAARNPFCTLYVDNNVDHTQTGFYMGVIIAVAVMGPALAYTVGGVFARIYVTLEDTGMHYRHPHWVGAWWLGYLTFGCVACLVALPLFCFPRHMTPGAQGKPRVHQHTHRALGTNRVLHIVKVWSGFAGSMGRLWTNAVYVLTVFTDITVLWCGVMVCGVMAWCVVWSGFAGSTGRLWTNAVYVLTVFTDITVLWYVVSWHGFAGGTGRLGTNAVYVLTVLSSSAMMFSAAGVHSFSAKYIENLFAFPAWKANLAMAGVMLGSGCVGILVGGCVTRRLQMDIDTALRFTLVMSVLAVVSSGLLMVFHCPQPYIYNSPGPRAAEQGVEEGCGGGCVCDDGDYFPVCAQDGRTFFSPCHAGCQGTEGGSYVQCRCAGGGQAVAGTCDYSCPMFVPFVLCCAVATLFNSIAIVPKLIVTLRVVEERDKALGLGYNAFVTSSLVAVQSVVSASSCAISGVSQQLCNQWCQPVAVQSVVSASSYAISGVSQ
ncbi:hypothetical protein ACOMHN_002838 [Nucella lapillus]